MILGLLGLIPALGSLVAIIPLLLGNSQLADVVALAFILPIAGVILGIVCLATKRPGKVMAVTGIVVGTASFVLPAVIIRPAVSHATQAARQAVSQSNLKAIGVAIIAYRQANNQAYPASFDLLAKEFPPSSFKSLSAGSAHTYDCFYLAPAANAPPTTMVACDYKDNREGQTRNVLHADGSVEPLTEPRFQQALTQPENAAFAEASGRLKDRRRTTGDVRRRTHVGLSPGPDTPRPAPYGAADL